MWARRRRPQQGHETMKTIRMWAGAMLALACTPALVSAEPLEGSVTDAATGTPVLDARVRVLGTNHEVEVDAQGRWELDLPPGTYELEVRAELEGEEHVSKMVRQYVPQIKDADAYVYTSYFLDMGVEPRPEPIGLPGGSGRLPADAPSSLPIGPAPSPTALTLPGQTPRRIRVGRRQTGTGGCRNNPIVAIEEMDLDEYVKGVLPPEIGVFRSIDGASEVYKEFAIAAKSYGLYFMLNYDSSNRRTVDSALPPNGYTWFHIDDTACNQRYDDQRLTITTAAADDVQNKIMVKKGAPNTLDKLEYAASCGEHGTLPEYGTTDALVDDDAPVSPCVGSWCGHDGCAGHSDNPNLAGDDRCLVRGICQWGSAAWGAAGRDYEWMIAHYQPNLEVRELGQTEPVVTVTVKGYVYTDPDNVTGSGVAGATVRIGDELAVTTDGIGLFTFTQVPLELGSVTVEATAQGYKRATTTEALVEGETNWASVQILPLSDGPSDPTPDPGPGTGPDEEPDPGPGVVQERPGRLDALVNTSPGLDGGCCAQSPARPRRAPLSGLVLLGATLLGVRRRR